MVRRRVRPDDRRVQIARLTGIVDGYCGGHRRDLVTPDDGVAELRKVTTDPDVLAEAAAGYLNPPGGGPAAAHAQTAYRLLLRAGADETAVAWHRHANRTRPRGFNLADFANGLNRLDGRGD
jgi:hypothetical protein